MQVTELNTLQQEFDKLIKNRIIEPIIAQKIVLDYSRLVKCINAWRDLGYTIVMTIGSYDLFHVGHARFLFKVKKQGLNKNLKTILVVGIDSDIAIKRYKGEHRPIINALERLEMLAVQHGVDYVSIIDDIDESGKWYYGLLRMIRPDIFVAVEDSYPEDQRQEIANFCSSLIVLPRQAENTSSSLIIQKIIKANPELLNRIVTDLRKHKRNGGKK